MSAKLVEWVRETVAWLRDDPDFRGTDTADRLELVADELEAKEQLIAAALAELDRIEDRAPHDIDGEIYTKPWADGIVAGAKRLRRILNGTES
jgi:hypothetical protein